MSSARPVSRSRPRSSPCSRRARPWSPASRSGAASMPTTWAGPLPRPSSDTSWTETSRSRSRGASTSSARTSSRERTTPPGSSGCSRGCRETTTSSSRRSWRTRMRRQCCASSAAPAARLSPPPRPAPAHSTPKSLRGSQGRSSTSSRRCPTPSEALARARELAGPEGAVLVTGLALPARGPLRPPEPNTMGKLGERLSVFAVAAVVVLAIVGFAFAAGYLVGKLLL